MMAALTAEFRVDGQVWWEGFGALMDRVRPRFARFEPARHAAALVQGLLSGLPRKNCWTIAEHRGDARPDGLQHLLSRARWDAEVVRDDLRGYVVDAFADPSAVLIVDETGDVKKGALTVGTQRQYTGTAGRIENSQVAVYLTYAAPAGHALIDRALYLPESWTSQPDRLERAGVPADVEFATKPALAAGMIERALDAGVPAAFVAGDEVYGNDPALRGMVAARGLGYVLAVASNRRVTTSDGVRRSVKDLAAGLPAGSWQRQSAGAGTKGHRFYSWALIQTLEPDLPGRHWTMVRRNDSTGELAYYRCSAPAPVPLTTLVRVAGQRWKVEESFQTAKGQAGLDEHQVRTWTSWHRWTVLAMLAMAFLAVITATQNERRPAPADLVPISNAELRHLFDRLTAGAHATLEQTIHWSHWRRRHQATARNAHYRCRSQHP